MADKDIINDMLDRVADKVESASTQWEAGLVRRICTRLKINARLQRELYQRARDLGDPDLTARAFNDMFDDFPYLLAADHLRSMVRTLEGFNSKHQRGDYAIHKCAKSTVPTMYKTFRAVPFVQIFEKRLLSLSADEKLKPFGMIFPRKGFANGLIIHNDESMRYFTTGHAQVYKGTDARPALYIIQTTDSLLEGIYKRGRGWKPIRN